MSKNFCYRVLDYGTSFFDVLGSLYSNFEANHVNVGLGIDNFYDRIDITKIDADPGNSIEKSVTISKKEIPEKSFINERFNDIDNIISSTAECTHGVSMKVNSSIIESLCISPEFNKLFDNSNGVTTFFSYHSDLEHTILLNLLENRFFISYITDSDFDPKVPADMSYGLIYDTNVNTLLDLIIRRVVRKFIFYRKLITEFNWNHIIDESTLNGNVDTDFVDYFTSEQLKNSFSSDFDGTYISSIDNRRGKIKNYSSLKSYITDKLRDEYNITNMTFDLSGN